MSTLLGGFITFFVKRNNLKVLSTKVYWDKPENRNEYKAFWNKYKEITSLEKSNRNKDVDLSVYKEGVRVFHKKFGKGVITKSEPEDDDLKLDISFEKSGMKRLMAKYARLEILN